MAESVDEDFDYYEVLGLAKGCSDADIKKAYKKAALQWHPDKNPDNKEEAEKMFKKVAEAYTCLGDQDKRALYDRGGRAAVNGSGGGRGGPGFHFSGDAFDIFEQFFGGRDPFAEMFGGPMGGMGGFGGMGGSRARGGRAGTDPFASAFGNDPFFSSGFGGGGGGASFSSFSSSSFGGGMTGSSTTTTTRIVNGQRVTVTEKTVRKADGTTETTRTESSGDGGGARGGSIGDDPFFRDPFGGGGFGGDPFGSMFGGGGSRNNRIGF